MKAILIRTLLAVLLLSASTSLADLWVEIQRGPAPNSVSVRVMDSEFRATLYWIDRSDDGGKTWTPWMPVFNGDWTLVPSRPAASFFRARLTAYER